MLKASILTVLISLTHPTKAEKNNFNLTLQKCDLYGGNVRQVPDKMKIVCLLPDRMDSQYENDKGDFTGNIYELWLPEMRNT